MNQNPNSNSTDQNEETIERPDAIETGMPAPEEEGNGKEQDPATTTPDSEEDEV